MTYDSDTGNGDKPQASRRTGGEILRLRYKGQRTNLSYNSGILFGARRLRLKIVERRR